MSKLLNFATMESIKHKLSQSGIYLTYSAEERIEELIEHFHSVPASKTVQIIILETLLEGVKINTVPEPTEKRYS